AICFSVTMPPQLHRRCVWLLQRPLPRAEQFPGDFYVSGELLFCKFCQHSVNWRRKNTCDDHLLSKSHATTSLQRSIISATFKSSDSRKEFEDFVAMCAEADIALEKMTKLRPFLKKYCRQGGALPENVSSLRQVHLPQVFEQHTLYYQKYSFTCLYSYYELKCHPIPNP
uniref:U1-type domain-containing protein n=1 Tax=Myripristis murdjan TaxID=586833 RepID=A0A667YJ63_9TELE